MYLQYIYLMVPMLHDPSQWFVNGKCTYKWWLDNGDQTHLEHIELGEYGTTNGDSSHSSTDLGDSIGISTWQPAAQAALDIRMKEFIDMTDMRITFIVLYSRLLRITYHVQYIYIYIYIYTHPLNTM